MEHTFTRSLGLALALSLFAGSAALGKSPLRSLPDSARTVPVPTSHVSPWNGDGIIGTLGQWRVRRKADRVHRSTRPALRIRLGRSFTITVAKG